MYLILLNCACLIAITLLSIFAQQLKELRSSILAYGKLNVGRKEEPRKTWVKALSELVVPKHYFRHFYVNGLATSIACWIELLVWQHYRKALVLVPFLQQWDNDIGSHHISKQQCIIGLTIMTIQLLRRTYETQFVEKPSKTATMHFSHYLIGIVFYWAMVLGSWLEGASQFNIWDEKPIDTQGTYFTATNVISVALFAYASYHQYICHSILANLRKDGNTGGYSIPRGDWFEYIVAPHYFADILVYVSLNILYHFQNYIMLFGLIWTTTSLSIVANETQTWYYTYFTREKYDQAFPKGRWRIIPGFY